MDYTTQMLSENVMKSALDSHGGNPDTTTGVILWLSLVIIVFLSLRIYIYKCDKNG